MENNLENNEAKENFSKQFLGETLSIIYSLNTEEIEKIVKGLTSCRDKKGRLFVLGVGGSAGHASHAVNDFRKICKLESYTPTDNVSELSARVNDEGWENCFANWLKGSNLNENDALLIFSVGGGNREKNISNNLVKSMEFAKEVNAKIYGIVGKEGGFTKQVADACVVIPPLFKDHITPHTEGLCAVIWHLMVSHPDLKITQTTWESINSKSNNILTDNNEIPTNN